MTKAGRDLERGKKYSDFSPPLALHPPASGLHWSDPTKNQKVMQSIVIDSPPTTTNTGTQQAVEGGERIQWGKITANQNTDQQEKNTFPTGRNGKG